MDYFQSVIGINWSLSYLSLFEEFQSNTITTFFNVFTISTQMFLVIRKFEIYGPDWCSIALDVGKLVISIIMCNEQCR